MIAWLIAVIIMAVIGVVCCGCVVGLLFCDIRFTRYTGAAAALIHQCHATLEVLYD